MSAFLAAAKALKNKNKEGGSSIDTPQTPKNKMDIPFNLDEIFQSDTDRFAHLRDVLKFIIDHLEKTTTRVTEIDIKMQSKFMEISQIKEKGEKLDKDILSTNMICKALELKSNEAEE